MDRGRLFLCFIFLFLAIFFIPLGVEYEISISWFGLLLLLGVIEIYMCKKEKHMYTTFCIWGIFMEFMMSGVYFYYDFPPWHHIISGHSSDIFIELRDRRQAVRDYANAEGYEKLLLMEKNFFSTRVSYKKDVYGFRWRLAPYTVLRVMPNAIWIGCDLNEYLPVETCWERIWQNRSYSVAMRQGLARRYGSRLSYGKSKFFLYGSKDIMTLPKLNDAGNLYEEKDNAIWMCVDYPSEEDVL